MVSVLSPPCAEACTPCECPGAHGGCLQLQLFLELTQIIRFTVALISAVSGGQKSNYNLSAWSPTSLAFSEGRRQQTIPSLGGTY